MTPRKTLGSVAFTVLSYEEPLGYVVLIFPK